MPGDWIKVESDLHRHPKVLAMALRLGVTSVTVVGCSIATWGALDQFGTSGIIEKMGPEALDSMVQTPGFAQAMQAVGWLVIHENGDLEFPDYERHNGPTAKSRAAGQKRVQKHRVTSVTAKRYNTVNQKEKENKIVPPTPKGVDGIVAALTLPKELDSDSFRKKFREWIEFRLAQKRTKKPEAMFQSQLRKLGPLGATAAIRCIDDSISNGWQGIFPERVATGHGPVSRFQGSAPAPMSPAIDPEEIRRREAHHVDAARSAPLERWSNPENKKNNAADSTQENRI